MYRIGEQVAVWERKRKRTRKAATIVNWMDKTQARSRETAQRQRERERENEKARQKKKKWEKEQVGKGT